MNPARTIRIFERYDVQTCRKIFTVATRVRTKREREKQLQSFNPRGQSDDCEREIDIVVARNVHISRALRPYRVHTIYPFCAQRPGRESAPCTQRCKSLSVNVVFCISKVHDRSHDVPARGRFAERMRTVCHCVSRSREGAPSICRNRVPETPGRADAYVLQWRIYGGGKGDMGNGSLLVSRGLKKKKKNVCTHNLNENYFFVVS
jgi:hypothetical protein